MSFFEDIKAAKMIGGSGGGTPAPTLITKSITANGNYSASADSADGYSQVSVDVPNTYSQADNGKVVLNGALVAQGSDEVTENGTVDTTLISSLTVNVSGGGGGSFKSLTTSDPAISNNNMVIVENSDYIVASGTFNCASAATRSFNIPTEILSSIDSIVSAARIRSNGTPVSGSNAAAINSWDRKKIDINAVSGSNAVIIQFSKKS